jgi:hypothetical protein
MYEVQSYEFVPTFTVVGDDSYDTLKHVNSFIKMLQSGSKQMVCTHVCVIFSPGYMAAIMYSLQGWHYGKSILLGISQCSLRVHVNSVPCCI